MIGKLVAIGAACLCVSAAPKPASTGPYHYPAVRQVDCDGSKGTAFLTEKGWITVAHVSDGINCKIDGNPIKALPEPPLDFSRLDSLERGRLKINCGGFIPGQWYHAIGYAYGWSWQTTIALYGTVFKAQDGKRMLFFARVIPGMSGGPIVNSKGEVVGVVNAYSPMAPVSYSQELKGTSVCR